ncbi:hypothetical protein [Streptomyces sp. TP-A0874]|nr:hypothetical protein [Streptomyces sp. TP-A0874]
MYTIEMAQARMHELRELAARSRAHRTVSNPRTTGRIFRRRPGAKR